MLVHALLSGKVTLYILKKNCMLVCVLLFGGLTHLEKELRAGACSSFWESDYILKKNCVIVRVLLFGGRTCVKKELRAGACSSF